MFKQTKAYTSIRNKLVAAVAMLLVASIMMVSSSYAWFTLSTAPEVTGITTTVGSNGSLEIALAPADGTEPTSDLGDAVKDVFLKNTTWGNLVDLSDARYGLDKLILNLAKYDSTNNALNSNPLSYPEYGADGRPGDLVHNTNVGRYDTTEEKFIADSKYFGVRGVGSSTTMSAQQAGLASAKSAVNLSRSNALTIMRQTLNKNGAALADMLIAKETANQEDFKDWVDDIGNLLVGIDSSLDSVEAGLKATIKAYLASKVAGIEEEATYNLAVAAVDSVELSFWMNTYTQNDAITSDMHSAIHTALTTTSDGSTNPFNEAYNKYSAMRTSYNEASTAQATLVSKDTVTWTEMREVLDKLVNMDTGIKVCGFAASDLKENLGALVTAIGGDGITVTMEPGSGLFADMAMLVGDYTAKITLGPISYGTIELEAGMEAKMSTVCIGDGSEITGQIANPYMVVLSNSLSALQPSNESATTTYIDTYYGYILDLFFRTNAAQSSLLLQTEAADRVYEDNAAGAATEGDGANMIFTVPLGVTEDQLQALVSAIRVVFFKPDGAEGVGEFVVEARLDPTTIASDGIVDANGNPAYKADLKLWITKEVDNPNYDASVEGSAATTLQTGFAETKEDSVIMALEQNVATRLSVLVYIDGNEIQNDDVANAATSMNGVLNLQFSSDADLQPMNYAPLKQTTTENP